MSLERNILFGLEQVAEVLQLLLGRESRALALSSLQMRILQILQMNHPPQGVVSVARRLGITAATVSDAVRVLYEKDLISKRKAPRDRRAVVLTLTQKGKDAALSGERVREAISKEIALLPEEEQRDLLESLINLIRNLLAGNLIPIRRMCLDCCFFRPDAFPDSDDPHFCAFVGARFGEKDQTACIGSSQPMQQTCHR